MNPLRWPFYLQTIAAMLAGAGFGLAFGPKVAFLGVAAKLIIQLIKALATPLLFFAILDSVLEAQFKGRGVLRMIGISAIDGAFAITFALVIVNLFNPGSYLVVPHTSSPAPAAAKTDWAQGLAMQLPESIAGPFANNTIPAVIVLALFFGFAILSLERKPGWEVPPGFFTRVREVARFLLHLHLRGIEWIVHLAPIAVFGAVAKSVGESGFAMLPGLAAYVGACLAGMLLQVALVYQTWIRAVAGIPLGYFWRSVREAVVYSLGVNSSLATLPLTLKALDKLKVSPAAARLSACVGTNLNNDGILLYEVVAALFIAQAHGIALGLPEQLGLAAICVFATIGVAGVPEAGLISLTLVLSTAGLPAESLPLLLTVDWILARCRSAVNVVSDVTVGVGIDALSRGDLKVGVAT